MAARSPRRLREAILVGALAVAVAVAGGCGGGAKSGPGLPAGTLAPDFSLTDVNPASGSFAADVSPRAFLGSGTAWYFGHAT